MLTCPYTGWNKYAVRFIDSTDRTLETCVAAPNENIDVLAVVINQKLKRASGAGITVKQILQIETRSWLPSEINQNRRTLKKKRHLFVRT